MRINHQTVGEVQRDCTGEKLLDQQTGGSRMPCKIEFTLDQQLGNTQGYSKIEDALKIAELNSGGDAILQGPDNRFYPVRLNQNPQFGAGSAKRTSINIDGKTFKVVCFVDEQKRVLAQADGDKPLENLSSSAIIRRNLSQHANSANAVRFPEKALIQVGAPDWQDKTWPSGLQAAQQEGQVIQQYTSMVIQQFRHDHGRPPSLDELPGALIKSGFQLPYKPTNTPEGARNILNDPINSLNPAGENSARHFLKNASGRCGDVSDFLYKCVMSGSKQLGFEKQATQRLVRVGAVGNDGINISHGAVGLLPPGKYLSPKASFADIQVYDFWANRPQAQPLVRWAEDYCFRDLLSATKNLMTPFAFGEGSYNLEVFYPPNHPYTGPQAPKDAREYLIQNRNVNDANFIRWEN